MAATTMPDNAGLRWYRKTRRTGTHVGVYNGDEAGFDTDGGTNPWSTVCEEHGGICSHRTRALAEAHAPRPEQWCPECQILMCPAGGCGLLVSDNGGGYICPECGDEYDDATIQALREGRTSE